LLTGGHRCRLHPVSRDVGAPKAFDTQVQMSEKNSNTQGLAVFFGCHGCPAIYQATQQAQMKTISVLSPARIADRSSILGVNDTHTHTGEYSTQRQEGLRGARWNADARDLVPIATGCMPSRRTGKPLRLAVDDGPATSSSSGLLARGD
jgi:hypothetical protein